MKKKRLFAKIKIPEKKMTNLTLPETDFHLIAVCSKRKGEGKTWFCIALCQSLAMRRKKVLLFDAEGGLENVAWQLGLNGVYSYSDLLSGNCTLSNALAHFEKGHFDIIAAPAGENIFSSAPDGRLQILAEDLRFFAKYYDYVIIDSSATEQKAEKLFLLQSTDVILLTTPDSEALVDAYQKLEFLKKTGKNNIKIVINKVSTINEGKQIFKTIIETAARLIGLNAFLLGAISRDARVKESVSSRSLIQERYPDSDSTKDVAEIARKLCEEK